MNRGARRIIEAALQESGLTREELFSGQRVRRVSDVRKIAMHLMHARLGLGANEIAAIFGRDHGTVHKNVVSASNLISVDKAFAARVQRVISFL